MTDPVPQEQEEDLFATVGENIGSAAGKIVAGVKHTAESLGTEKAELSPQTQAPLISFFFVHVAAALCRRSFFSGYCGCPLSQHGRRA